MTSAVVGSTAAVLSNKLLQMANGAVYDESGEVFKIHDKKLDTLQELVDSVGDNLLVFYNYKHDYDRIVERFPEARRLDGPQDIDDWNAGKIRMLLCHPASAAYGINLQQGGHTVAWFGLPWSLELHTQANARLYRQGQEHPVIVHYIVAKDTLDEKVLRVLQNKDAVQQGLLDALKDYVKEES
jgi:SNF2 family DNA or RNA helicase